VCEDQQGNEAGGQSKQCVAGVGPSVPGSDGEYASGSGSNDVTVSSSGFSFTKSSRDGEGGKPSSDECLTNLRQIQVVRAIKDIRPPPLTHLLRQPVAAEGVRNWLTIPLHRHVRRVGCGAWLNIEEADRNGKRLAVRIERPEGVSRTSIMDVGGWFSRSRIRWSGPPALTHHGNPLPILILPKKILMAPCRTSIPLLFPKLHAGSCLVDRRAMPPLTTDLRFGR
jgi:hypothetical protein